jgi:hypothetical protein
MKGRPERAEVAGVYDNLYAWIGGGEFAQEVEGAIRRCVIDENVLPIVLWEGLSNRPDLAVKLFDIFLLVVGRRNDADSFHEGLDR